MLVVSYAGTAEAFFRRPMCGPAVCPPPMCPPPPCAPAPCAPAPCAPVPCAPRMCAPVPCPPPACAPRCGPNPLAMILGGAVKLVAGAITLPFKIVDRLFGGPCSPRPVCRPRYACGPPPTYCAPPMMCPPPMCGPPVGYYPPAFGFGMRPGRPVGFGRGAPRRFAPIAREKASPVSLMAESVQSVFGAYW
jgi:hypothetical protein